MIAEPEQIGFDGPRAEGESTQPPADVRARGPFIAAMWHYGPIPVSDTHLRAHET